MHLPDATPYGGIGAMAESALFAQPSLPPPDAVQLWLVRPLSESGAVGRLERLLSCDEVARAARFRMEADRAGFVSLHAAARIVLGAACGRSPASLVFHRLPGHKPILADANGLHFSLSRSRGIALIGVAAAPLGVDVEAIRPIPDADAIALRYFAASEAAGIAALPAARRLHAFFACWSRKEAFVKAVGLGLAFPLDRFELDTDPSRPALLSIDGRAGAAANWSLWAEHRDDFWSAAAIERPHASFQPVRLLDLSPWA